VTGSIENVPDSMQLWRRLIKNIRKSNNDYIIIIESLSINSEPTFNVEVCGGIPECAAHDNIY